MIEFVHVTKRFPTGQTALEDVSFSIKEGEFVVLTGESGAGKTTLMRLLIRDLLPTEGDVIVFGEKLRELRGNEVPQLRRTVSVIFQDYKLLPDRTVYENISLPLEIMGKKQQEIQERIRDLLTLVDLEGKEQFFPVQLSGGEAQRISIARALAVGPRMIFADEPTGNLDHDSALSIATLLKKIQELGTTVMMATHNLDLVKMLKARHLHLHKGKIEEDEKKREQEKPKKTREPENESENEPEDESEREPKHESKHESKKEERSEKSAVKKTKEKA